MTKFEYFYDGEFKVYEYYDDDVLTDTLTINEVVDLLNKQEKQLKNYKGLFHDLQNINDDLGCLLGLMTDNNLTWGAITQIIEEALDDI